MKIISALFLLAVTAAQAQEEKPMVADTIYIHGNIYTGVALKSPFPMVERVPAMAVRGDRILAAGKEPAVLKHNGPQTKIVDLGSKFVMPGFNDAHLHLASGGFQMLSVDLTGTKSLEEFRSRIRARVEKAEPEEWIVGSGWDHTAWPVKELPSRWDLDEVTAGHPAYFQRVDGHIAVANTRALQLAGITIASKDPEGGKIDRLETGEPTGILRETAREAVDAVIPKPNPDRRRKAIELALQNAARWGLTSAQDNSSWEDFQIYEELEKEGKLTLRISEWLSFDDPLDTLRAHRDAHPRNDSMLQTGMLKGFMDGSLGSRTAALLEPYADDPGNLGLPQYDPAKLNQMAKDRAAAGFQLGFHAIGDKGAEMALSAFAEAEKEAATKKATGPGGTGELRLRIEHAQVTTPEQIQRFKTLKVIASMQPNHLLTDMNWAEARIGARRAAHSYAWAEFLQRGVMLAFGTDYPVEPVTPFRGLYAAVTRKSEDGKREYFPAQKITIDEAIAAYTSGAAYAEFAETEKGTLAPGMLADFVVLDRDITAIPPAKILETKVLRTVVGGKTVYEAK
jgi:hypothetical protein